MSGHNFIAVYGSREDVERTRDHLIEFGIPERDIWLCSDSTEGGAVSSPVTDGQSYERDQSFWDWLFGSEGPEHDRPWHGANLREGRTAVSVLVQIDAERDLVAEILEELNPVHIDQGNGR